MPSSMGRIRGIAGTAVFVALAVVAGCGPSQNVATLEGKVTYKGQPLPGGKILIQAVQPGGLVDSSHTYIEQDGSYRFHEAPVGEVRLAVDTAAVKEQIDPMAPPEYRKQKLAERLVKIPARYGKLESSGLTLTLKAGRQKHDLALTED